VSTLVIVVNGRSTSVPRGATVRDLIAQLKLSTQIVVVEFNGEPLSREEFATTDLSAGDTVEIAQMVGGG